MSLPDRAPSVLWRVAALALAGPLLASCATRKPPEPGPPPVASPQAGAAAAQVEAPAADVAQAPSEPVAEAALGEAAEEAAAALEVESEGGPEELAEDVAPEEAPAVPSPLDELAEVAPEVAPEDLAAERSVAESRLVDFDIPIELNDTVLGWVDFFTTRYREKFLQGLVRSGRYLPMIRDVFRAEGLPLDLAYLVHVESAYRPEALSRAKARGLFQFMAATARRYGLRVDWWVDERVDPEKATRAAAAYLKDLYAMFGDWHLALAAYNAGEGKVQRSLRRTGAKSFWSLARTSALTRETRSYVPAILAATLISKDPARYGFEFSPDPPLDYDTIQVRGAADLRVLARCAGTDLETMRALNPALRRLQTPSDGTTEVRVPKGAGQATLAALEEIPRASRVLVRYHRVRRGDTLSALSRRYGVPVAELQRANGLGPKRLLRVGQVLKIPSGGGEAVARGQGDGRRQPAAGSIVYRVQRGDTLSAIARRYGTTVHAIARASRIGAGSLLRVGQRLRIPVPRTANGHAEAAGSPPRTVHTVRYGETLWQIANLYRMSVEQLCALNGISREEVLRPGTRLTVSSN